MTNPTNFYTDNPDIEYNLERLDLPRLADLLEADYHDAQEYDFAPENGADARESYLAICKIAGDLSGGPVMERARQVDEEGHTCDGIDVCMHPLVKKSIDDFRKAQLLGLSLPRQYGGLNMPQVIKVAILEMVARADASLMNLVGLQDIAETIDEFGTHEQKMTYNIPLAHGEATAAMVLTEPDSGSDLQSVRLVAHAPASGDDKDVWLLKGVKRFITNGCGNVLLILARSEDGTKDGRGLSMFVCFRDKTVKIRRIENKLGIHGSPTCEMVFDNTPCYLVGSRKRGLIRYVMALMNGARIGIAAQALGIGEAAYRDARDYAKSRVQFGKAIDQFPAVYEMLTHMQIKVEAGRILLYQTAKVVDLYKVQERRIDNMRAKGQNVDPAFQKEVNYWDRLAAVLTPFSKLFNTEMANQNAYDGIQIMGGSGFMKDYNMERYYRDARITNIYEGTSQLQVVAAIGGLMSGSLNKIYDDFCQRTFQDDKLAFLAEKVRHCIAQLYKSIEHVKSLKNPHYTDYVARRVVEMGLDTYVAILFLECAENNVRKAAIAEIWVRDTKLKVNTSTEFILANRYQVIDLHKEIIGA
ncbi:MAG: acyl-CoA dehydrogenase family protein [Fibrobacterota bacterium]